MTTRALIALLLCLATSLLPKSTLAQFPGLPSLPSLPGMPGGSSSAAIAGLIVYIIQKHEASERQKQIAQERARRAYANMSSKRKASLKAKKVRYIAVDTVKDEKTSPEAKKSVMVWDTESEKVAGKDVYDVKSPPKVGATAKFDKYSAEYVGSGA
jgi:hypothetical protein